MFEFLETLKERGKKLFMLTNSPFNFVDGGMRFMLEVIIVISVMLISLIIRLNLNNSIYFNRVLEDVQNHGGNSLML